MSKDLKETLILRRLERVYCKLAPSPIHGVGIFAIKDIPKGTNPFVDSYMAQEAIVVNKRPAKRNPDKSRSGLPLNFNLVSLFFIFYDLIFLYQECFLILHSN